MRTSLLVTSLFSLLMLWHSTDQLLASYFAARSLENAQAGTARDAIKNIDRAIRFNSLVSTYRLVRASYYFTLDKPEATYAEVKSMVALHPQYFRHQVRAGQMLNPTDAEAHYLSAIDLVPNSAKLREQVAAFYLDIGEPGPALKQLDIAIGLLDDSAWALNAHYLAGLAYLQLDDPEQAQREFRETIERSTTSPVCYKALVLLTEMLPDYEGRTCR